jgi:hypothetical protein
VPVAEGRRFLGGATRVNTPGISFLKGGHAGGVNLRRGFQDQPRLGLVVPEFPAANLAASEYLPFGLQLAQLLPEGHVARRGWYCALPGGEGHRDGPPDLAVHDGLDEIPVPLLELQE